MSVGLGQDVIYQPRWLASLLDWRPGWQRTSPAGAAGTCMLWSTGQTLCASEELSLGKASTSPGQGVDKVESDELFFSSIMLIFYQ